MCTYLCVKCLYIHIYNHYLSIIHTIVKIIAFKATVFVKSLLNLHDHMQWINVSIIIYAACVKHVLVLTCQLSMCISYYFIKLSEVPSAFVRINRHYANPVLSEPTKFTVHLIFLHEKKIAILKNDSEMPCGTLCGHTLCNWVISFYYQTMF